MSHQFGFLQAFAGYDSATSLLLTTFRREKLSKKLYADLRLEYCRLIKIMLQADMGKFQTQIRKRLRFFQQISLYCSALSRATPGCKSSHPTIGRAKIQHNRYIQYIIQRLKQVLILPDHKCDHGDIFDIIFIARWLCKDLLSISSYKFCLTCSIQSNIYQTSINHFNDYSVIIKPWEVRK